MRYGRGTLRAGLDTIYGPRICNFYDAIAAAVRSCQCNLMGYRSIVTILGLNAQEAALMFTTLAMIVRCAAGC